MQDFLKEYCNVVVGQIKTFLSAGNEEGETAKEYLPEITPSYDQYGVHNSKKTRPNEEWWKIIWNDQELVMCSEVNCGDNFNGETIKSLSEQGIISVTHDGKVRPI